MRISVLAGPGSSSNILLNWLSDNGFSDVEVIVEKAVPRKKTLKSRVRRIGLVRTAGQVAFIALILPFLQRASLVRRAQILKKYQLRNDTPIPQNLVSVENINDEHVSDLLESHRPDLVLVNGTRIIRKSILDCVKCPIINTHTGITPKYRGVHGGYWALWNSDKQDFGVTIHLVDSGVDTGPVIAQRRTKPSKEDNFASYPLLQQAISFEALSKVLHEVQAGSIHTISVNDTGKSRQWYHPTIWQYLSGKIHGIK